VPNGCWREWRPESARRQSSNQHASCEDRNSFDAVSKPSRCAMVDVTPSLANRLPNRRLSWFTRLSPGAPCPRGPAKIALHCVMAQDVRRHFTRQCPHNVGRVSSRPSWNRATTLSLVVSNPTSSREKAASFLVLNRLCLLVEGQPIQSSQQSLTVRARDKPLTPGPLGLMYKLPGKDSNLKQTG
jgi:hypothetical protein